LSDRHLPVYTLFKSEQVGGDKEAAVRTPLTATLKSAIKALEADLKPIADQIEAAVKETTERTLERLRRDYPEVARNLVPEYKSPSWSSAFSLDVLRGDDDVPLNKRGAGVRRLVVLAFFQAEAEKRKRDRAEGTSGTPVIYGIEEPETSQHPDFQKNIIKALEALSAAGDQVLLTTHVPGIAALIPTEAVRLVTRNAQGVLEIETGNDGVYDRVAETLGLSPDRRAQVAFYVEGPNDVEFFLHAARLHRTADPSIPDLERDHRIAFVPTGGGNLQHWVNKRYLDKAKFIEVHVYDTDDAAAPKYQAAINAVNARGTQDVGYLTSKRELENYIHADAIQTAMACNVVVTDWCDVPALVAEQIHVSSGSPIAWANVDDDTKKRKASNAKRRLNSDAASTMTLVQLQQMDPGGEIHGWLCAVRDRCE
jgi:putative ATP-dependent endonuclease of OLD family